MAPKDEPKRMAAYMPLVGVRWDAESKDWAPFTYDPIVLFKGKGNVEAKEKQLYNKAVLVVFQEHAATDTATMQRIAQKWCLPGSSCNRLLIMDAARQHFTEATVTEFRKHTSSLGRVPEGWTSFIQFLDLYWFFVFKSNYRKAYSRFRSAHPGPLTAAQKRVMMTNLIAEAHAATFEVVKPKIVSHFTTLGYLYTPATQAICPPPFVPFGYKFAPDGDIVQ